MYTAGVAMSTSWTPGSQPSIFSFREELDEVSNRRLTSMALDIARGLAYLADLKYVHRYRVSHIKLDRVNGSKLRFMGQIRKVKKNESF